MIFPEGSRHCVHSLLGSGTLLVWWRYLGPGYVRIRWPNPSVTQITLWYERPRLSSLHKKQSNTWLLAWLKFWGDCIGDTPQQILWNNSKVVALIQWTRWVAGCLKQIVRNSQFLSTTEAIERWFQKTSKVTQKVAPNVSKGEKLSHEKSGSFALFVSLRAIHMVVQGFFIHAFQWCFSIMFWCLAPSELSLWDALDSLRKESFTNRGWLSQWNVMTTEQPMLRILSTYCSTAKPMLNIGKRCGKPFQTLEREIETAGLRMEILQHNYEDRFSQAPFLPGRTWVSKCCGRVPVGPDCLN